MRWFTNGLLANLKDLKPWVNKNINVAGIINDVEFLESKNGKQWGKFTLEDFSEQYEFRIFGEEFLKFKHFISINQFVRLKLNIREGWLNQETGRIGDPRIQFLSFEMLHDAINNNSKKLTLKFDIRKLQAKRILSLKSELNRFKGDKPICFDIIDSEKSLKLTLNSRKQKVNISPELLDHLDNNDWIYKLN